MQEKGFGTAGMIVSKGRQGWQSSKDGRIERMEQTNERANE